MEATGTRYTDRTWDVALPENASPVIGAFLASWRDHVGPRYGSELAPYFARTIDTRASRVIEERRSWMAIDWCARLVTPVWLQAAALPDEARWLRYGHEVTDGVSAMGKLETLRGVVETLRWRAKRAKWAGAAFSLEEIGAYEAAWAAAEVLEEVAAPRRKDPSDRAREAAYAASYPWVVRGVDMEAPGVAATGEWVRQSAMALLDWMVAAGEPVCECGDRKSAHHDDGGCDFDGHFWHEVYTPGVHCDWAARGGDADAGQPAQGVTWAP